MSLSLYIHISLFFDLGTYFHYAITFSYGVIVWMQQVPFHILHPFYQEGKMLHRQMFAINQPHHQSANQSQKVKCTTRAIDHLLHFQ